MVSLNIGVIFFIFIVIKFFLQAVQTAKRKYCTLGERLIYKWTPISEIDNITLYPEFLKNGLKELTSAPKHLIINDYKM